MTELKETDPRLVAVCDKNTNRNLLADPTPLTIDMTSGKPVQVALAIKNGPEGLVNLTIASDEPWLVPQTEQLTLVGGENGQLVVTVRPEGNIEYANLLFSWQGVDRPLNTAVMLMRKLPTPASKPKDQTVPPQAGAYVAEISRENPTCFLFLVDHSGSMAKPLPGAGKSKAKAVAEALNRLLYELVSRASKGAEIRDHFEIGIIGYGHDHVGPALGGVLSGRNLVPVSQVAEHPLRVEMRKKKEYDGTGGILEVPVKVPVWYEAAANGMTPMCGAIKLAHETVQEFLGRHPQCRPPVVINITDGMPSDADPRPAANALRKLRSTDGNVLLFNLHVSEVSAQPILFPTEEAGLPNKFARLLYRMSSTVPSTMLARAREEVPDIASGARGFVFNADMIATIQMLEIGTRGK